MERVVQLEKPERPERYMSCRQQSYQACGDENAEFPLSYGAEKY